ncbi:MAG: pentapeptide repeat-containing protein [Alphaproteobacteria bacterium]
MKLQRFIEYIAKDDRPLTSRQQLLDELLLASFTNKIDFSGICDSYLDFSGLVIGGGNFRSVQLDNIDFSKASLDGADFSDASLLDVNFQQAVLKNCVFSGANLQGANLRGADVEGADFTGANLVLATITDSNISTEQLQSAMNGDELEILKKVGGFSIDDPLSVSIFINMVYSALNTEMKQSAARREMMALWFEGCFQEKARNLSADDVWAYTDPITQTVLIHETNTKNYQENPFGIDNYHHDIWFIEQVMGVVTSYRDGAVAQINESRRQQQQRRRNLSY